MQYYSNPERTKLIATNKAICAVITRSDICQNVSAYTIPYNKAAEEQLEVIDEQTFKEAYDSVTAFMTDLFIQTNGKGLSALLSDAKNKKS